MNRNADGIKDHYVERADLVEILSPGTAGRDVGIKRERYEAAQIAEYWIVDPAARTIEVLDQQGGAYEIVGVFGDHDCLECDCLPTLKLDLARMP